MNKIYTSAPLPFQGQKRNFLKQYKEALHHFDKASIFVDLFGGSGLLSHIAKAERPDARVIYNDYDNYSNRLANIDTVNMILNEVRPLVSDIPIKKKIPTEIKSKILDIIESYDKMGFVDYYTLSANLLFSGNYVNNLTDLKKHLLYNRLTKSKYNCDNYLDGLEIVHCDYSDLLKKYQSLKNVVFIVDPPYLSTECSYYENYWKLTDYLNVINVTNNVSYIYFTSNKSSIIELLEWTACNSNFQNPFNGAMRKETRNKVNKNSSYTDIMLYRQFNV